MNIKNLSSPYRRATWGCYRVARVSDRIALCRDFEGYFEKPFDEIRRDVVITEEEYLTAERLRSVQRFDSSLQQWGEDLKRFGSA